jgi:hypothetical protein
LATRRDRQETLFSTQLQKLIDRETLYLKGLCQLRDAFWMPLARRYLGGPMTTSSQGQLRTPRRRFSLLGLHGMPRYFACENIVQTLNGMFGYVPALYSMHDCLNEELQVL